MSVSTCGLCSDHHCLSSSSSSETRQTGQLPGWCDEIQGKVYAYGTDIDDYLHTFVPSPIPCNVSPPSITLVENWDPQPGREKEMYDPLVKILTAIVKDFPQDKRPSFSNPHEAEFPFPFSQFSNRHHPAKPDLIASFPGDRLPAKLDPPDWSRVAMAIEAKDVAGKDPFVTGARESSEVRSKRLVQLAVDARSLMLEHGFLASYLFGVYGSNVRVARFDHTCVVASSLLDIQTPEGLRGIQEFFWRFVHPWEGGPGAVVGSDPTFRKLNPVDEKWLRIRLAEEADEMLEGVNLREGRLVKVYDEDKPAEPKTFLLFKLLDVNARLFSRSTMVWLGIEDTRCSDASNGATGAPAVLRVLKESWRQVIRIPEQKFYQRLTDTIPADEWYGLPKLLHGGDLGVRDVKRWEAARSGQSWPGEDDLPARMPSSSAPSTSSAPAFEDIPHPMHQTFSLRLCGAPNAKYMERSHVRFVVDTVGRPLSRFKSTRELVMAMRDAIKGHRLAMKYGGILHRDVSSGNILIVDRPIPEKPECKGVLHDYDYSSMTAKPPSENAQSSSSRPPPLHRLEIDEDDTEDVDHLKERTGTYYFISNELLKSAPGTVLHDVCHDLESFFWVLVWIVLRHTNYRSSRDCTKVFVFGDDIQASINKGDLVSNMTEHIEVVDNPPLTQLLGDFKLLVYLAFFKPPMFGPCEPLTYDSVIAAFDKALAREDWPVDDKAIPFSPLKPQKTNTVFRGPLKLPIVATGSKKAAAARGKRGSAARNKNTSADRSQNASASGSRKEPGLGSKKRPLEEHEQEEPSTMASSTLFSGTDGPRSKRSKHTHSATTPATSSRVTRSQTKRSGQLGNDTISGGSR